MLTDNFRGDNAQLVRSIEALLELDAEGALVPHGVGGHARALLSAAAIRLAAHPGQPEPRAEVTDEDIITACDAHGITLPVEALEAATALVNHFGARAGGA
ncbi:hypothetical protein [Burkholderia sp. E168m30]|uniref:hypothetical protein n=1 Tax=Burkholderia sp. E168m30 TaxID=1561201 RepID=UPI0019150AEA|nr:hypothetical protein [Burkholderia sp. E168m30]